MPTGNRLARFFEMPPYFGRVRASRTIALLCANHQLSRTEIGKLSGGTGGFTAEILAKLLRLGVIGRTKRGQLRPYFLNPKHPSYKGFRAFGRAARAHWAIPSNALPRVPRKALLTCSPPIQPACDLFGYEAGTRCLLFIAAAGKANTVEIADLLGGRPASSLLALRALERRGLITRPTHGWERAAIINQGFFARDALLLILRGLLTLHPDIATLVAKMRKFRPNRHRKANWHKPHIKGPRRGL